MNEEESLTLYVYRLLGRREYSEHEIRTKAQSKGYEKEVVNKVIAELQRTNMQSDQRCAEAIWEQYKDSKGKQWILQKYKLRRIDPAFLDPLMDGYQPNLHQLKSAIKRKYNIVSFADIDYPTSTKISAYLMRRGFSHRILSQWKELDEGV